MMTTSEILRAAAARVRQGWIQGAGIVAGRVCAYGSIAKTVAPDTYGVLPFNSYCFTDDQQAAIDGATRALKLSMGMAYIGEIYHWNDLDAQTAENVSKGLERAADLWEAQHVPKVEWTHRELAEAN